MRRMLIVTCFFIGLFSCESSNTAEDVKPGIENDPDWIRLEVPDGQQAFAVAGDIDDTLLVTTLTKAYLTFNKGESWQESYNFDGPIPGLLERNDTVFALSANSTDKGGNPVAGLALHYTIDHGKTWGHCYKPQLKRNIGIVTSSSGVIYFIKENFTPVSEGSTSFFVSPSEIEKNQGHGFQRIDFPFKRALINLHLDNKNRLYVAASGGEYVPEDNAIYCCKNATPAIVYISRKPLP